MSPIQVYRRNLRYYSDLIDVVGEGIVCTDQKGFIVLVNQTALHMWGYQAEEFLGESFEMIYVEEDRCRCCPRVIQQTLAQGQYQGEFLFQRKDGSRFPGHLSSSWIGNGDQRDLVFAIHDLTEQKRLQQSLLESQKMAFLGKVVEGLSHEIRNPIVTLGGYARRLRQALQSDHPGQEYVRIILADVRRMEEMLKEIEGYVHFAQTHRPSFMKVDLQLLVQEAMRRVQVPGGVQVNEDYPPEGPWIYGDPSHLRELFYHLLENAVEAMPKGGRVSVRLVQVDGKAEVIIADTGVGISADALPHIYSPFFTTKTKGAGVGLAKAYMIVEAHAGDIEVQSQVQKGTTFRVCFPLDRRQAPRQDEQG